MAQDTVVPKPPPGFQLDPEGAPAAPQETITAPSLGDFIPSAQTPLNFASGVAEGTGQMLSSLPQAVMHPIETVKGIGHQIGETYKLGKMGEYVPAAATALGIVGFNEPEMAKEWSQGRGSEAIGQALPSAALAGYGAERALGRGPLTVSGVPASEIVSKGASHLPTLPARMVSGSPLLTRIGSAVTGGAIGGRVLGGGEAGGFGLLGGVYEGDRLGQAIVRGADESLINKAIAGTSGMDRDALPVRLRDKYDAEVLKRAQRAVKMAQLTGQKVDLMKLPSSIKEVATDITKETSRKVPVLPRGVLTPEEIAAEQQAGRYFGAVKESMEPEGSAIGSAHQTYRHEAEFTPAEKTSIRTTTKGYRLTPKIYLPLVKEYFNKK